MSETPLAGKLRLLIEANGPMTIADYMAHCLGDPAHGYYMTRDPFGQGGDFVTAPEVSQMFGEIVAAWLIETWRGAGSSSSVRMVELGPGRGTLMADILRVAEKAPDFRDSIVVHLVETSPTLRARQAEMLAHTGHEVSWHDAFGEVPDGPLFLVANEFFDALPIRQFVQVDGAWRERVVGLDADGRLAFGLGPGLLADASLVPPASLATGEEPNPILEIHPAADALVAEIAHRIVTHGGGALLIDYGYATHAHGETLQAVQNHRFVDPLAAPGEADLTAHVDFAALGARAEIAGAAAHGPITQGDFLLSLGLLERASRLGAKADDVGREALRAAAERLAGPAQMGMLFKVLAITRPGVHPAPFPSTDRSERV